jgi:hypothetical protein
MKITREEQVNYLRIALNVQGININNATADLIIQTWEAVKKKGDRFSLKDAARIDAQVRAAYKENPLEYAKKEPT